MWWSNRAHPSPPLWQDGTVAILTGHARLDRISAEYNATYVAKLDHSYDSLFTDSASSGQASASKGLVGILQAMRLCDQVDLFGFADTGGSIRYHCMQLQFEPGRELTPAANLQLTFGCPSIGTDWDASISTGEHAAENLDQQEVGVDLEHRFIRRLSSEPVPVCAGQMPQQSKGAWTRTGRQTRW